MGRPKRWLAHREASGKATIELASWKYFSDFIYRFFLDIRDYVWRGQSAASWPLEPTLDRVLRKNGKLHSQSIRKRHLEGFKFSARGRRGSSALQVSTENEWWALGQHHGLATPLLDWTTKPFVALYFAFENPENNGEAHRAVYVLSKPIVEAKSSEISKAHNAATRAPIVEFVNPVSDDNARLVNQGGLFTRGPDGITLEQWVINNFKQEQKRIVVAKIIIPNSEREQCLRALNRMNINHLTLFPDLYGSSKFSNFELEIDGY
jgi:hypothetical protein